VETLAPALRKIQGSRTSAIVAIRPIVFSVAVCFLLLSCGDMGRRKTWSAESRSPDGRMVATGETIEELGMGGGGGQTNVYLNWTNSSKTPALILVLTSGAKVQMNWVSPNHLELTYGGPREPWFQARYAGVNISARRVPGEIELDHPK
jgi:hypothetical protein